MAIVALRLHINQIQAERVITPLFQILLAISIFASGFTANASEKDVIPEVTGVKVDDVFERATKLRKTYVRVEELMADAFQSIKRGGSFKDAAAQLSNAAELASSAFGENHWETQFARMMSAGVASVDNLPGPRQRLYREAERAQSLAAFLQSNGQKEKALIKMRESEDKCVGALGSDHILTAHFLVRAASQECEMGEFRLAIIHGTEACKFYSTHQGVKCPLYANALYCQAVSEYGAREFESSERHLKELSEILWPIIHEGFAIDRIAAWAQSQVYLSRLLNDEQRYAESEPIARRASEILAFLPKDIYGGAYAHCQLEVARSTSGQGKHEDAEIVFTLLTNSAPKTTDSKVLLLSSIADHLRRNDRNQKADMIETLVQQLLSESKMPQTNDDRNVAPSGTTTRPTRTK